MSIKRSATVLTAFAAAVLASGAAQAGSITLSSQGAIYDAGRTTSYYGGSALPAAISLPSGTTSVQFGPVTGSVSCTSSTEGCISLNGGGNLNDPDGNGAAVSSSSNTGTSTISGIKAPGAGYLVGLFVDGSVPTGTAPAPLDFTVLGTSFTSLSPLLDQTFFIGDGLTGDGTGTEQTFEAPTGATMLYLGIVDAGGYNGSPGSYTDNVGSYTVAYTLAGGGGGGGSPVPEPTSLALLGVGLLGLGLFRRTISANG